MLPIINLNIMIARSFLVSMVCISSVALSQEVLIENDEIKVNDIGLLKGVTLSVANRDLVLFDGDVSRIDKDLGVSLLVGEFNYGVRNQAERIHLGLWNTSKPKTSVVVDAVSYSTSVFDNTFLLKRNSRPFITRVGNDGFVKGYRLEDAVPDDKPTRLILQSEHALKLDVTSSKKMDGFILGCGDKGARPTCFKLAADGELLDVAFSHLMNGNGFRNIYWHGEPGNFVLEFYGQEELKRGYTRLVFEKGNKRYGSVDVPGMLHKVLKGGAGYYIVSQKKVKRKFESYLSLVGMDGQLKSTALLFTSSLASALSDAVVVQNELFVSSIKDRSLWLGSFKLNLETNWVYEKEMSLDKNMEIVSKLILFSDNETAVLAYEAFVISSRTQHSVVRAFPLAFNG